MCFTICVKQPRISASSYSNTAPLVWSFLYGQNHGKVELVLDNAPARSAELLAQDRVDAALVPVIACQTIENVRLIPDVCVGAREKVRSVCLVTNGQDMNDVRTVSLDVSSKTSVILTKIVFREFLGFEPVWRDAEPDLDTMLAESDAALIIGDPALALSEPGAVATGFRERHTFSGEGDKNPVATAPGSERIFDLAQLWHDHTGLGFVFAMWMTNQEPCEIDFAAARDEGLAHIDGIAANYASETGLSRDEMKRYLTENISYSIDESMQRGMQLYFELAEKHGLIPANRPLNFL
jgi:chorismate dehydratase